VILEATLDELMQDVRGDQLMYVGMGKVVRKWLNNGE
jgi:hypothetical protein